MIKKILIATAIIISFASCKINYSFTGASIPQGAETFSISDFPNMAPLINPMLSSTFTEAMRDKFISQTSLQITQYDGDLHFEGTITNYNTRPMNIQAESDQAAQNRLTITVKVKFVNNIDEKSSFESSFSRYSDYSSDKLLQDVENELVDEIVEQLVEDIFNKAVVNW